MSLSGVFIFVTVDSSAVAVFVLDVVVSSIVVAVMFTTAVCPSVGMTTKDGMAVGGGRRDDEDGEAGVRMWV